MRGLGLGLGLTRKGAGAGSPPTQLILDPPVTTAMGSAAKHAFGFDRYVQGYSGNTVRLKRLSDNAQQDFGFNALTGEFDLDAVNTWRSGADVDLVQFYDQKGSALWTTTGTVAFIRSDIPYRFGCDRDDATDLLTRSTTNGALGVSISGGAYAVITGTSIPLAASGLEAFMLFHMNTRKAKVPANDTVSSNNTNERVFSYGTGSDNFYRWRFNNTFGTFADFSTKPAGGSQTDIGGSQDFYQQYGQQLFRLKINSTAYESFISGGQDTYKALNATSTSEINGGILDNGTFVLGASFSNSAGAITTTEAANFTFGGMVITTIQSALNSFMICSKMGLIGQQHQNMALEDVEGLWDEIVLFKDTNPTTGVLTGINNQLTVEWNAGTNAAGTKTSNLDYDDPVTGLNGVYTPDDDNLANGYLATSAYFAGVTTGSVFAFHVPNVRSNRLAYVFGLSDQNPFVGGISNVALQIGKDHATPSFWTMAQIARDPLGITGTRKDEFGVTVGDARAGSSQWQQSMCKYNRNVTHSKAEWGRTFDSYTWSESSWANEDPSQPYEWDAPVRRTSPQNLGYNGYNGKPILQIGTFQAPEGYNRADNSSIRNPLMLQASTRSYVHMFGSSLGHTVGDIARNTNACVCDSTDTARIHSPQFQGAYAGVYLAMGFKAGAALTDDQVQKFGLNAHKLFA